MANDIVQPPSLKDLLGHSVDELEDRLGELRRELVKCRIKHATSLLEKTSHLRDLRKAIARILTLINQAKNFDAKNVKEA